MLGFSGSDDSTHTAELTIFPRETLAEPIDHRRQSLVHRTIGRFEVLNIRGTRIAGPNQGEYASTGRLSCGDHRLE